LLRELYTLVSGVHEWSARVLQAKSAFQGVLNPWEVEKTHEIGHHFDGARALSLRLADKLTAASRGCFELGALLRLLCAGKAHQRNFEKQAPASDSDQRDSARHQSGQWPVQYFQAGRRPRIPLPPS
jgi:hypothetical protein